MTRILVTGASGFVGSRLVPALRLRGHEVIAHSTKDGHIAHCTFPEGASHVYHLAALTYVPDSWKRPVDFYNVNVLGTVNVLEYCRAQKCPLTFISSYVYGHPQTLPIAEDHPLQAVNPYAHTKLLAEDICRFYQDFNGVAVTIVRPFNLYGPGQADNFLIPLLLRQMTTDGDEEVSVADLRPRRDFIYIDDLVELLLLTAGRTVTPARAIYNAGSGVSHSVGDVINLIASLTGRHKPVRDRQEHRPHEIMDVVADIRKAKDDLGWTPRVTLLEGLRAMLSAR